MSRVLRRTAAACVVLATALGATSVASRPQVPSALSDAEFWRLVTTMSEPGGRFAAQLMSNEDSAQFVLPALTSVVRPGGAYIGVGSEPNFTYVAATSPSLAFVLDIRRDNMLEHLLYKALFELSADRAEFVSRLFSRPRPEGLRADAGPRELFETFRALAPDATLYDRTRRDVRARLVDVRQLALTPADLDTMDRFLDAFRTAGPDSLKGYGDGVMLTYAELMAATGLDGEPHGYLASEARYRVVRDLQQRNLVVPIVGDFAGDTALAAVGAFLRARGATVSTFYVSNVERYLFQQGERGRTFYANVAALPLTPASTFIRSVTTDISRRLGIPIPDGPARWRTFLVPIQACLDGVTSGRIQTYRDLFLD